MAPFTTRTSFWRRHGRVVFDLTALLLCFLGARFWHQSVALVHLAPACCVILLWGGAAGAPGGAASPAGMIFRPVAVAMVNLAVVFFFADSLRGLGEVLGGWCLLAAGWPFTRAFWSDPAFRKRLRPPMPSLQFLRKFRAPATNLVLPILLAWALTTGLHRRLYPVDTSVVAPQQNSNGPIRLRVKLPGTSAGIPEPLVVCGIRGNASLVYIRLLGGNRAKVGVEFWGLELDQGDEFPLPAADAELDLNCSFPALFPAENDPAWGNVSPSLRKECSSQYWVTVNGVVRLRGSVSYRQPPHSGLYFGENPLGGSFISSKFTGTILKVHQGG